MESESESSSVKSESESEDVSNDERNKIRDKLSTMSFEDLQKLKNTIGSKVYNETVFGVNLKKIKKTKMDFKRANKNRPREMSSKKPIKIANNTIAVKKTMVRDPRFDNLCGSFHEKKFKSDYKFVYEIKKKEMAKLEEEYKACNDHGKREKIKFLIQRLGNQIRENENKKERDEKIDREKGEIKEKLKKGEKPSFKKKCKMFIYYQAFKLFIINVEND